MKRMVLLVMLGLGIAGPAMAAVEDCPDPDAEQEVNVPGATRGGATSLKCKVVDYGSSLEPGNVVQPAGAVNGTQVTPVQAVAPAPEGAQKRMPLVGSGDAEAPEQEPVGGMQTDYNATQLGRIGELDAMQGRPLNMQHASDLTYLQGYTRGQQKRAGGGTGGGGGLPAPGARRLW